MRAAAMLVSGAGLRAADVHGYQVTGRLDRQGPRLILDALRAHHIDRGVRSLLTSVLSWVPTIPCGDRLHSSASFGPALSVMRDGGPPSVPAASPPRPFLSQAIGISGARPPIARFLSCRGPLGAALDAVRTTRVPRQQILALSRAPAARTKLPGLRKIEYTSSIMSERVAAR